MNRYRAHHALIFAWSIAAAACGGEDAATPADDGCEHMIEGPGVELDAVAGMLDEAPDMAEHHVRHDITLAGDAPPYSGYVDLIMAEPGQFVIFLGEGVPLTLFDASGEDVPPEVIDLDVTECAEVSAGYTFDFGVGTYRLRLGPSESSLIQVVVVDAAGDEHG